MLFFSKKVKWVHLGMVVLVWENYTPLISIASYPNPSKAAQESTDINLGVAKHSCWHFPLVATPT